MVSGLPLPLGKCFCMVRYLKLDTKLIIDDYSLININFSYKSIRYTIN